MSSLPHMNSFNDSDVNDDYKIIETHRVSKYDGTVSTLFKFVNTSGDDVGASFDYGEIVDKFVELNDVCTVPLIKRAIDNGYTKMSFGFTFFHSKSHGEEKTSFSGNIRDEAHYIQEMDFDDDVRIIAIEFYAFNNFRAQACSDDPENEDKYVRVLDRPDEEEKK